MPQSRQLAAIMFTDIEGYTAIMQQNEQHALSIRKRHREILQKEHAQYNGRVIQYYGDGTLSVFQSAIQAVQCAVSMQQAFCQQPVVPLRIGLHVGDVVFDDDGVVGDGVNLASRIESLGIAGCVLISDRVKEEISNHPEFKTVSVGNYQFKNLGRKVEVFALDHDGLIRPRPYSLTGKTEPTNHTTGKNTSKSIAVLPFVNMSNDPDQEYFGDGVAEEILNSLVHVKDLKVAGRTSSFRFKGKNVDLRKVGQKLGVSSVLEGSVRKQGPRLRITVQLIDVEDGFHLWSERYDRNIDDIFAIQDEIALAITEKLKVTLLEVDLAQITKTHTQNTEAYELYLKGRFYLARRGRFVLNAIEYFQKAIELDPGFSLGYAGYADANFLSSFYSLLPGSEVMDIVKHAAETAIKLDPLLCEPYVSLAFYHTALMRNWEEGEKYFIKALEINPRYSFGHYLFGLYYYAWAKGDFEKAEEHTRIAIKLDPLSPNAHAVYGLILYFAGKHDEGLAAGKAGLELDPNSFLSYRAITLACTGLKKYAEATESAEHLIKISNRHPHALSDLMKVYSETGKTEENKILMDELKQRSQHEFIDAVYMAFAAAYTGNLDEAFTYLDTAFTERDPNLIAIRHVISYSKPLSEDPRYEAVLKRMSFPE
jgi:TolB-like protein/class 3 adenylate cyclase/Tfp pilus assembly protein PilF